MTRIDGAPVASVAQLQQYEAGERIRDGIGAPAKLSDAQLSAEWRAVPAGRRECIRLGLVGDCRKGKLCPGCDGVPIDGVKEGNDAR